MIFLNFSQQRFCQFRPFCRFIAAAEVDGDGIGRIGDETFGIAVFYLLNILEDIRWQALEIDHGRMERRVGHRIP